MRKNINRFLQLLILSVVYIIPLQAQRLPFYIKAEAPEYLQQNREFDISLLVRIFDFNADKIILHVLTEDGVELRDVNLNGVPKQFTQSDNKDSFNSFDIRFDFSDNQINFDSFLNLKLTLHSRKNNDSQIDFTVDYVKDDKVVRKYSRSDFTNYENAIDNVILTFYSPDKTAGNSVLLTKNSNLGIIFNNSIKTSNYLVEFWGRFEKSSRGFFKFINGAAKDTLVSLNINGNKFLSTNDFDKVTFIKDCFISKNAWYHFSIFVDVKKAEAGIYVNDYLAMSTSLNNTFSENSFEVLFANMEKGEIELDQLKIWDFKNYHGLALQNKNYENYRADSSKVYLTLSFNEEKSLKNYNSPNIKINSKGIKFIPSTAPIYSKAPELNVYLYNDFYQIEWKNNSRKDADFFELEKSENGLKFKKIYEAFASEDFDKVYYYTDPKDVSSEVIYYRVKQLNKDGSDVYSSTVKIGQGEVRLFNLGQNYPNPFNPQTTISIEMIEAVDVDIYVYDIVGEKVAVLNKGLLSQGIHTFSFDGSNLPSGIYFCEAKSEKFTDVRKMILAK